MDALKNSFDMGFENNYSVLSEKIGWFVKLMGLKHIPISNYLVGSTKIMTYKICPYHLPISVTQTEPNTRQ